MAGMVLPPSSVGIWSGRETVHVSRAHECARRGCATVERGDKTHDHGVSMAGVKRCLLRLDRLRKRTGKLMATEGQAVRIADDIVESVKRVIDDPGSSAPVSILFGHSGEDVSAGRVSAKKWRMACPSSSDGAAGPAEDRRTANSSES